MKTLTTVLESRSSVREMRASNRRVMRGRRPAPPDNAIRYRIKQWNIAIDAARAKGGKSGARADRYLARIKGQISVAHGGYAEITDPVMAKWLGCHSRTVRRYREWAESAKLVEVVTHGEDHKACMVRPIMPDGSPVFTDTSALLSRTIASAGLTESELTESLPPLVPPDDEAGEGEEIAFREEDPTPPAAPPPIANFSSVVELRVRESDTVMPAEPPLIVTFAALWLAAGQKGTECFAMGAWSGLGRADKIAISALVMAGKLDTRGAYLATWLKCRRWETAPPRQAPNNALGALGLALLRRIGSDAFSAWFGKGELAVDAPDRVVIAVPTRFIRDRILQDFGDVLAAVESRRVEVVVRRAS